MGAKKRVMAKHQMRRRTDRGKQDEASPRDREGTMEKAAHEVPRIQHANADEQHSRAA
jgi:hypothetical protein